MLKISREGVKIKWRAILSVFINSDLMDLNDVEELILLIGIHDYSIIYEKSLIGSIVITAIKLSIFYIIRLTICLMDEISINRKMLGLATV